MSTRRRRTTRVTVDVVMKPLRCGCSKTASQPGRGQGYVTSMASSWAHLPAGEPTAQHGVLWIGLAGLPINDFDATHRPIAGIDAVTRPDLERTPTRRGHPGAARLIYELYFHKRRQRRHGRVIKRFGHSVPRVTYSTPASRIISSRLCTLMSLGLVAGSESPAFSSVPPA